MLYFTAYKTPTQMLWEDYWVSRPSLESIDSLVDVKIDQARRQGAFENLSGRGKPLDLSSDERMNPYLSDTEFLMHRMIQNQGGHTLPWIEKGKEVDEEIANLRLELKNIWKECFQDPTPTSRRSSVSTSRGGKFGFLVKWIEGDHGPKSKNSMLSPEELEQKQRQEWQQRGTEWATLRIEEINTKVNHAHGDKLQFSFASYSFYHRFEVSIFKYPLEFPRSSCLRSKAR
jgi:hypothetical protein